MPQNCPSAVWLSPQGPGRTWRAPGTGGQRATLPPSTSRGPPAPALPFPSPLFHLPPGEWETEMRKQGKWERRVTTKMEGGGGEGGRGKEIS